MCLVSLKSSDRILNKLKKDQAHLPKNRRHIIGWKVLRRQSGGLNSIIFSHYKWNPGKHICNKNNIFLNSRLLYDQVKYNFGFHFYRSKTYAKTKLYYNNYRLVPFKIPLDAIVAFGKRDLVASECYLLKKEWEKAMRKTF